MKPTLHKTKEYSKFPLSLPLKPIKLVIRSDEQDCGMHMKSQFSLTTNKISRNNKVVFDQISLGNK